MNEFKNWFAWYPVAYGPHISWLKTIQHRYAEGVVLSQDSFSCTGSASDL